MEIARTKPDLENRKIRYRTGIKVVRSKGRTYFYARNGVATKRSDLDGWRADSAKAIHKTTKGRAAHKRRSYELSAAELVEMLKKTKDRCQVTGLSFDYQPRANRNWRTNPFAPSLDRIDNKAGYELGNVRLVCACVNYAINEFGLETFARMCRAFVTKNGE